MAEPPRKHYPPKAAILQSKIRARKDQLRDWGLWSNPVLQRELNLMFGGHGAVLRLLIFAAAVAGAVYLAWPREQKLLIYRDQVAGLVLAMLSCTLRTMTVVFGPALAAMSVTRDKERGVMELLCSSPVSPRQIFNGKFMAGAMFLWLLTLSTLPVAATVYLLGGVDLWRLADVYVQLFLWTAAISAYSVMCSAGSPHSTAALTQAYGHILPLGAIWAAEPIIALRMANYPVWLSLVWIAIPIITLRTIRKNKELTRWLLYPLDHTRRTDVLENAESWTFKPRDPVTRLLFPRRLTGPMRGLLSPVLTRELRYERLGGAEWMRNFIPAALILGVLSGALFIVMWKQSAYWHLAAAGLAFLLVPALAAPSISREFEQGTFYSMVATTLRPMAIIWPKIYVAARTGLVLTLLLTALALPMVAYEAPDQLSVLPLGLAVLGAMILLLAAGGVFCSLWARSSPQAMVWAYGTLGALLVLGPLFCLLLRVFTDIPVQSYAWLSYGSPAPAFFALAGTKAFAGVVAYAGGADGGWTALAWRFITFALALSGLLFVVMVYGFDYFWKKGPLRRL